MTQFEGILIFGSAILAGGMNAIAGGGSFISFPALIFIGVPPINANATSTVALWPGSVASVGAYRHELSNPQKLLSMLGIGLLGGTIGSLLLLNTSSAVFLKLIPYLLLVATLLFTFSKPLTGWITQQSQKLNSPPILTSIVIPLLQLAIAIYGGYFGGGIGILLLATFSLMGMDNLNKMNALKTLLASAINGIALIPFILSGVVDWQQATLMGVGAILGGYLSAHYAQKIEQKYVRYFIICVGFAMTAYFFVQR